MSRGEVWWHEAPNRRARPHLVLTRDEAIPVLTTLLAIPATTTIRGIPTEVRLDELDGMPIECVLSVDNVTTVDRAQLTRRITKLSTTRLSEVCDALAFAIDC